MDVPRSSLRALLIFRLPESIKFLASQGKRFDLIARFVQRLAPGRIIHITDQFIASDEIGKGESRFHDFTTFPE